MLSTFVHPQVVRLTCARLYKTPMVVDRNEQSKKKCYSEHENWFSNKVKRINNVNLSLSLEREA